MLFCIPPDTGGNERGYTVSRTIMLIPTGTSVGLTSVSLGVIRAMERKGVRLSVFKPIAQPRSGGDAPDQTTTIVGNNIPILFCNYGRNIITQHQ